MHGVVELVAQGLSVVGSAGVYVPLLLVIYWCVSPAAGARALVLLALSGSLNELGKLWMAEPRPYWTTPGVVPGMSVESFGMPSGHAQNAVVVWGALAWSLGRPAGWVVAALLSVGIGWSRYALGVHSAGQILVGWTIGLLLLAAAIVWSGPLSRWWRARQLPARLALAALPSLVLFVATVLAARRLGDATFPWAWTEALRRAGGTGPLTTSDNGAAASGFLAGCLVGLALPPNIPTRRTPLGPAPADVQGGRTLPGTGRAARLGLAGTGRQAVSRVLVGGLGLCVVGAVYLAMVGFVGVFAPMVFVLGAVAGGWTMWGAGRVHPRVPPSG